VIAASTATTTAATTVTATGALFGFANSQNFTFAPLRGERDKQYEASLIIPYRGWNMEIDNYQTDARNWLDHNNMASRICSGRLPGMGVIQVGPDAALAHALASRSGARGLCQSDRAGDVADYGGLICPVPLTSSCPLDIPRDWRR